MLPGMPYRRNQIASARNSHAVKKLQLKKKPNVNTSLSMNSNTYYHQRNINDQLFQSERRKENYLNSKFNQRKEKLRQLTKDNKKIYERINSQKSLYSQKSQTKSYESLKSVSRCSSRSQSRNGKQNVTSYRVVYSKGAKTQKKAPNMTIQSESINKVQNSNLRDFQKIFLHNNQENNRKIANRSTQNRSFSNKNKVSEGMGSLLHRIAQELHTGGNKAKPLRKFPL